jgi:ABC-type bacteriocin/lantibiotic exporter with double-glycine peptidase domain
MKLIKLIKQFDETGCGIACIAMLANKDYEKVKGDLLIQEKWTKRKRNFYTKVHQLQKLLKIYKIESQVAKFKNWNSLKSFSIVGVNSDEGYFHWVISVKTKVSFLIIDPEFGEVYQGGSWVEEKGGYFSRKKSNYLCINGLQFKGIKI